MLPQSTWVIVCDITYFVWTAFLLSCAQATCPDMHSCLLVILACIAAFLSNSLEQSSTDMRQPQGPSLLLCCGSFCRNARQLSGFTFLMQVLMPDASPDCFAT